MAANNKHGLGRGLGALFGDEDLDLDVNGVVTSERHTIKTIKTEDLIPGKYQPRQTFDADAINALAESIKEKGIRFDVTMGAGTNNGGGEENKFLFDCLKHKLCVTYTPKLIAHVDHSSSTWFHGYDKKFFINRGYSSRKLLGIFLGCLYVFEWSILKYPRYKKDMSFFKSFIFQMKGLFFKP